MRRNLNFREDHKTEMRADEFLKNCPPRSVTAICAIAIEELIEKYGLESATSEDVARFIEFHDFLKKQVATNPMQMIQLSPTTASAEIKNIAKEDNSLVSKDAKNVMDDVLSGIFGM